MKAVILAAGKSTRTYPLTVDMPKPLLKVANKTLITHNLEQLTELVNEVIIVVGYRKGMIQSHLGTRFGKVPITYVEQTQQLGTGHALLQTESLLKNERFMVMMGDDLYFRSDMRRCINYEHSVLAKRVENYSDFGVFTKQGNHVLDLIEKPQTFVSDLANAAFYVFTNKVFACLKSLKKSPRGEYEITDAITLLAKTEDIFCVEAKVWLPIGYPWNLLEADQILRDDSLIGKGTVVRGIVTNSTVGENCVIEGFVKNSLIGDRVTIRGDSVVEDSIIADDVDFTGTMKSKMKAEVMINGRRHVIDNFGSVLGSGVKLRDVLLHPGTFVWPNIQKENVELRGMVQ